MIIWSLLIIYQLKHFLADYPLQTPYMLGKFKPGWSWVVPLSAHCAVHAAFTLAIIWLVQSHLWWLALLDFAAHFAMDRIKASPNLLGRFKAITAKEYRTYTNIAAMGESTNHEIRLAAHSAQSAMKSNVFFWWALGLDQMVHHLTHYFIIYKLAGG